MANSVKYVIDGGLVLGSGETSRTVDNPAAWVALPFGVLFHPDLV